MKKLIMVVCAVCLSAPALAGGSHYTRGYTTKSGTYVAPHYSSNPNSTKLDNYSTRGNVNPYTGSAGTVDPYKVSPSNPYGSPYNSGRRR